MVNRIANLSKRNSFFLFGARGTGKSTLIREQFLSAFSTLSIDLLNSDLEEEYSKHPMLLYEKIKSNPKKWDWIFIDEVQKVPKLLDVVHKSLEELKVKFILTGSSARKLKREGANLLAGRAFWHSLFPFTKEELAQDFHLDSILQWGALPQIFSLESDADKKQYLKSYNQIYLKEEIKAEQLIRNIDPFRDFLEVAAQMSGKIINYSKIGNDVGVDHKTVQNYFSILTDTLLGFILPTFHQSVRKSQRMSPKFYYFDIGVKNALAQSIDSKPMPATTTYGELFEHFIMLEIYRLNEYFQKDYRMSFLMTKNNVEIDLILTKGRRHYAIEIKSAQHIDESEVKRTYALAKDIPNLKKIFYISNHKEQRMCHGVECLYWADFLNKLAHSESLS